jgi:hypothetical protein
MKELIKKNLEMIQEKLDINQQMLSKNRSDLHSVIQQPLSDERTELFLKHFRISLELFSRNYHFIKLQFELNRCSKNQHSEYKTFGNMSLS